MPTLVWLSLTAVVSYRPAATWVALAEAVHTVAHARVTSLVQSAWAGPTRLAVVWRPRFVWERGCLMLDDPVLPKPLATAIDNVAWGSSRQEPTPVSGLSRVLRVWTNGRRRLPLGIRLWPTGGPSTYALALAWRSDARHRRRGRPDEVRFDAWSPSKALLKRMRHDGWDVVCRLQKHRRCTGAAVRAYRHSPYGSASGRLTGGLTVLVGRDGAQSSATNRLSLSAAEVRRLSRCRPPIDEVIRGWKEPCRLRGCPARSARAQRHHITGCLAAFGVRERDRHERGRSIDKRRRALSWNGQSITLPALERLRRTAYPLYQS